MRRPCHLEEAALVTRLSAVPRSPFQTQGNPLLGPRFGKHSLSLHPFPRTRAPQAGSGSWDDRLPGPACVGAGRSQPRGRGVVSEPTQCCLPRRSLARPGHPAGPSSTKAGARLRAWGGLLDRTLLTGKGADTSKAPPTPDEKTPRRRARGLGTPTVPFRPSPRTPVSQITH